jgi:hypothetical protein
MDKNLPAGDSRGLSREERFCIGILRRLYYPKRAMSETRTIEDASEKDARLEGKAIQAVGGASLLLAVLQSLCTAIVAINGVRVGIGLTALAAIGGVFAAPATFWHQDAIRIPMLWLATIGSLVIRHLRGKSSAQWRRREPSAKQKRSERLQIALAIVTLTLVALETWLHGMRTGHPILHL